MIKKTKIFYPQWMIVLDNILKNDKHENVYVYGICKQLKITYSHIYSIIVLLEEKEYINTEKQGRKVIITLTKIGKEKGILINKLMNNP